MDPLGGAAWLEEVHYCSQVVYGLTPLPACSLLLLVVDKGVISHCPALASCCHAFYITMSFEPLEPEHIINSLL